MYRAPIAYGSPTHDMTIRLRRAQGVEVRVHEASSGRPLTDVHVVETVGGAQGTQLQLRLDENGRGYIPSALAGSTLSIMAMGYAPSVVRNWSGEGLDLQLEPDKIR